MMPDGLEVSSAGVLVVAVVEVVAGVLVVAGVELVAGVLEVAGVEVVAGVLVVAGVDSAELTEGTLLEASLVAAELFSAGFPP